MTSVWVRIGNSNLAPRSAEAPPGGERAEQDHDSLDGRRHVVIIREHDAVTRITIEPTDKSAPPASLYGGGRKLWEINEQPPAS